ADDREFRHGWHWEKISKDGPGDWHSVSGTYTADPDRPLVTVLRPSARGKRLPSPPKCRYDKRTVEVDIAGGRTDDPTEPTYVRLEAQHDGNVPQYWFNSGSDESDEVGPKDFKNWDGLISEL
ncbi:MAG: hypothetical protein ACOCUM_03940, partial [Thiohalospira sp.]